MSTIIAIATSCGIAGTLTCAVVKTCMHGDTAEYQLHFIWCDWHSRAHAHSARHKTHHLISVLLARVMDNKQSS